VKLFAKDPLAAARDSKTKLTERLAKAEIVVVEKKEAAKRFAIDGADDGVLDKAESDVRVAQDRIATLTVAIQEVERQIAALEREQAEAADKALRAKTVAELEVVGRDLAKAAADFDFATSQLAKIAERIGTFIPEGTGLAHFCQAAKIEVPPTIILLKTLLQGYVSGVVAGSGRATLPQPASPPAWLPPPKPETVQVCSVKNIAWENSPGFIRTVHPGYDVELSPEVARHALAIGAVVQRNDPRAKFHSAQRKPTVPILENCIGLDAAAIAAIAAATEPRGGNVEPIMKSPSLPQPTDPRLTVLDRGPPRLATVARANPKPGPPKGNDDD
jgi:hypothetical protein